MAAKPVMIRGTMFPIGKSADDVPVPCVILGFESDPTLTIGGGPIIPPDQIPPDTVKPPLVIWGGPFDPPHPEHPIVLPPDLPPPQPPSGAATPPHPGWNWYSGPEGSGWYWAYIPGQTAPSPKK